MNRLSTNSDLITSLGMGRLGLFPRSILVTQRNADPTRQSSPRLAELAAAAFQRIASAVMAIGSADPEQVSVVTAIAAQFLIRARQLDPSLRGVT